MNCPYCQSKRSLLIKTIPGDDGQSGELVQQCLNCYRIVAFYFSKIRDVQSKKADEILGLNKVFVKILNDNDPEELKKFIAHLGTLSENAEFFSRRREI